MSTGTFLSFGHTVRILFFSAAMVPVLTGWAAPAREEPPAPLQTVLTLEWALAHGADSTAGTVPARTLRESRHTRAGDAGACIGQCPEAAELPGDTVQAARLVVMQRFFDALLAELRYRADEAFATQRHAKFERDRQRGGLREISPLEVARSENAWREALDRRAESAARREITRAALALALDRQVESIAQVSRPRFQNLEHAAPAVDDVMILALAANPRIQTLRRELVAAERQASDDDGRRKTSVLEYLETDAGSRSGPPGSRDDLQARLRREEQVLRSRVIALTQKLEVLRVRRETARQREGFRELELRRARAQLELQEQISLGDAEAHLAEAQCMTAEVEFETALTFARLDALMGRPVPFTVTMESEK